MGRGDVCPTPQGLGHSEELSGRLGAAASLSPCSRLRGTEGRQGEEGVRKRAWVLVGSRVRTDDSHTEAPARLWLGFTSPAPLLCGAGGEVPVGCRGAGMEPGRVTITWIQL